MAFYINPYRRPLSPFLVPVLPPVCDPDFQPVSVMVSCLWLGYIVGALGVLLEQATWRTDDPDLMLLTIERVNNLRDIFSAAIDASACATLPIAIACDYDFTADDVPWFIDTNFNQGTWLVTIGFESTHVSGVSEQAIAIAVDYSAPTTVTSIDTVINSAADGSGANDSVSFYWNDGSFHLLQTLPLLAGINHYIWNGEQSGVSRLEITTNSGTAAAANHAIVETQVRLLGDPAFDCNAP